jgi:hypothetical protein
VETLLAIKASFLLHYGKIYSFIEKLFFFLHFYPNVLNYYEQQKKKKVCNIRFPKNYEHQIIILYDIVKDEKENT